MIESFSGYYGKCAVILYNQAHLKPGADLFLTMSEVNQIPNYEKPIR